MQCVAHYAHDLILHLIPERNGKMLPERVFVGEVFSGEFAADNDFVGTVETVLAGKEAAAQQWYSECAEISRIGPANERVRSILIGRCWWMARNGEDIAFNLSCCG